MRQKKLKWMTTIPNFDQHVERKERKVLPTSMRLRKLIASFFQTAAGYRKKSKKIYRTKLNIILRKRSKSSGWACYRDFREILNRMTSGRKSLLRQNNQHIPKGPKKKKQKTPDFELDVRNESKCCRERRDDWDATPAGAYKSINARRVQKSKAPNLSSAQRSNFRIRLYNQLNVVKRPIEKPSYYVNPYLERHKVEMQTPGIDQRGKHILVERSKPIEVQKRRISDVVLEDREDMLPKRKTIQSDKEPENEDLFALDI